MIDLGVTTPPASMVVYVGTYTGDKSRGIYKFEIDTRAAKMSEPQLAAETTSPSFLAADPHGQFVYACNEIGNFGGKPSGAVTSFKVDPSTGSLSQVSQQPSGGSGPCYVSVTRDGRYVFAANYGSGSVAALPADESGKLSPPSSAIQHTGSSAHPQRQKGPHAHSIQPDPTGRFAFAVDLGIDQILIYGFEAGELVRREEGVVKVEPGRGPRHVAFHPNGRLVYACNEMGNSVTAYAYDSQRGTMQELQTTTTLPADFQGENTTAEVRVHPSGKFLYVSNRGHDSIAILSVADDGTLTPRGHEPSRGKSPRGYAIDPSGSFLLAANHRSDNIVLFRISPETGALEFADELKGINQPVAILFLPQN